MSTGVFGFCQYNVGTMKNRLIFGAGFLIAAATLFGILGSTFNAKAQTTFTQNTPVVRCVNGLPEVTLSWTAEDGALYYRVQRKKASTTLWSGILDSQIKTTKYADILWASDYGTGTYTYRLQAMKLNSSTYSSEVSVLVPECRNKPVAPAPAPTPSPTPTPAPTPVLVPTPTGGTNTSTNSSPTKFIKGDRVMVKKEWIALNTRVSPLISAKVLGTQPSGAFGVIVGGPSYDGVGKYWFWQVDYDQGVDGWSVEYWLDKVSPTSGGVSATPTPAPTTSPTPAPTQITPAPVPGKIPNWMKWGVYAGWSNTAMTEFEALTGKKPQMEMVFVHWGNETQFPFYYGARIRDKGRTMVLFWEASDYKRDPFNQPEYSIDAVLAGKLDTYFTNFAAGAKAYAGPVIIIPYSEMNGNWYPWGGTVGTNSPEKLIAAYRYIRKFFVGIPNVKFGFAPNSNSVPNTAANRMELYYPGDDVVDYVGVDGFNFGGTVELSFNGVFGDVLTRLKQYKKPIYIFSTASTAGLGKAAWISDALTVQLHKYPEVAGWLWFNQNKERDWRVNSDPNSLSVFIGALP